MYVEGRCKSKKHVCQRGVYVEGRCKSKKHVFKGRCMSKKRVCRRDMSIEENVYVEGRSKSKKRVCRREVYVEEMFMSKGGVRRMLETHEKEQMFVEHEITGVCQCKLDSLGHLKKRY